jgi:DegV family protein with EDD domain
VRFGNEEYLDGVDLDSEAFYRKLSASAQTPVTAQPAPAAFAAAYESLLEKGASHIVSLHLASTLSGTYNSASIAAAQVGAKRITVLDTRTVSAGLGLLALEAARRSAAGDDGQAVVAATRALIPKISVYATIPNLTFLARGGRIGPLRGLLGNAFKIVPVLTMQDGEIREHAKVRTFSRAVDQIVETVSANLKQRRTAQCAVVHAAAAQSAAAVSQRLQQNGARAVMIAGIGPTVGTHAGPGSLGVFELRS